VFQKGQIFWARGESSRAFDRVRLRILHSLGNCLLSPFHGSEWYTKWHALQTLYLLTTFHIPRVPGSVLGAFAVTEVVLFISVRISNLLGYKLSHIVFQSTYPVSVNVLAATTQSSEFSEIWVQPVQ
jgi:hypothetical protein